MKKLSKLLFLIALLALAGCQSSLMAKTAEGVKPFTPDPEKATIIFMRPSAFGAAVQSSVYLYDKTPQFVGIVSSGNKIAYQVKPGKHHFMVVGEAADFMEADLTAGYIYYTVVEPHFGFMKARFSLDPVPESEFDTKDFKDDIADCDFVTNTPASEQWFIDHRTDITSKHNHYFEDWQKKPEEKKHKLAQSDGRPL